MHRRAASQEDGPPPDRLPHDCGLGMIIAGGGTGGHLFPGIAIAEEFLRRNPSHWILFIGTERGLEKKILGGLGLPLRTIRVEGIKGRGPMQSAEALAKIPGSLVASFGILRVFRPDIVVGVGATPRDRLSLPPDSWDWQRPLRAKRISGFDQPAPWPFCRSDLSRLFSLPKVVP